MKYLIDTHILTNRNLTSISKGNSVYILEETLGEHTESDMEIQKLIAANIGILTLEARHLEKMKEVMENNGANLKLIRLFTSEGTGDIAMLSFILAERDNEDTLFPESYKLVTQDKELRKVAESYGIICSETID